MLENACRKVKPGPTAGPSDTAKLSVGGPRQPRDSHPPSSQTAMLRPLMVGGTPPSMAWAATTHLASGLLPPGVVYRRSRGFATRLRDGGFLHSFHSPLSRNTAQLGGTCNRQGLNNVTFSFRLTW